MKLGAAHVDLCQDSVLDPLAIVFPLIISVSIYKSLFIMSGNIHKVKLKTK